MAPCPTCGLTATPPADVARVLSLAMEALQDYDIKKAHRILGGLVQVFTDEARRQRTVS